MKKIRFLKPVYGERFIKQGTTLSCEDISSNEFILYKFIFIDSVETPQKFLAVHDPHPLDLDRLFLRVPDSCL